jgi:ATP-GRASP peptide maturase of grasp-with-spasm system
MNLVFSYSEDYTTKQVLEWLDYLGADFMRLNDEKIEIQDIVINNESYSCSFTLAGKELSNSAINSIWFRGGKIRIANNIYDASLFGRDLKSHRETVNLFLSNYSHAKLEYMATELSNSLGKNAQGRYNKLIALRDASQAGLVIPDTLATTSKQKLIEFQKKHEKIITKSFDLSFSSPAEIDEDTNSLLRYMQYTNPVPSTDLKDIPQEFALTVFQELILKKFEIRTFYLNKKCYSVAIFSQQNKKTSIDYRRYDYDKMNRMIPIQLPAELESKITNFMISSDLNTGSIDFIYSLNNDFVFLEVNPIGQFGYVSEVCNYKLHKKIATCLIQSDYKNLYEP